MRGLDGGIWRRVLDSLGRRRLVAMESVASAFSVRVGRRWNSLSQPWEDILFDH